MGDLLGNMTLHTRNLPLITAFVILNYIAFAYVNHLPWQFLKEVKISNETLIFQNPLIAIGIHLSILILCFIIPVDIKNVIIFWRFKNSLPGCRVFTELICKDHRIDIKDLENKYGKLPTEPREQNTLWYKIYKEKQDEKIILSSHGKWLLFRECAIIALIFVLLLSPMSFLISVDKSSTIYLILLIAQYFILRQATVNAAERFTYNVLAR